MRDSLRHFVAEFVGTFALVFVGSGAIISAQAARMDAALVAVALAHGLILAVMVSATMRISGHFNPAVPPEVDRYLFRLLHVQPAERPSGARDVHNDLERLRLTLP